MAAKGWMKEEAVLDSSGDLPLPPLPAPPLWPDARRPWASASAPRSTSAPKGGWEELRPLLPSLRVFFWGFLRTGWGVLTNNPASMQPNRRRKIEWDSSSLSSPTKYFKPAKGPPQSSPNQKAVFGKTQILHSPESSYKEFSRTSFAAEDSSSDDFETDDEVVNVVKETQSSFSRGVRLVNRSICEMSKRNLVSSQESLKHEVKEHVSSDAGQNLAPNTESKDVPKDAGAESGRKKVENRGAALIYRKALLGAFGKALTAKRDTASLNGIHVNSLHRRKEVSGPEDNLRCKSAGGEDPSCRKNTQKEQINISVQQDEKDSHGSDGSSRRVSVVSKSEREAKFKVESSFQKASVKEENGSSNHSGKEDVRPGCSSRHAALGALRLEDKPEPIRELKNQSSPTREVINTSVGQHKKKIHRRHSSSEDVCNFSRLEGEQKHKQASNKHQRKIAGKTDCKKLSKKESWTPKNNSRFVPEGARHESNEVFMPGSSNQKTAVKESSTSTKQKNLMKEQCTVPSSVDKLSGTKIQFENFQRTVLVEPSSKLAFVDEHDAEVDQKCTEQEKEPLEGSDWSDTEDAEPPATFSQEDSIQNHNISESKDSSALSTEFVMYPPHLYSHTMKDYTKYWAKTPKSDHCSPFSSPCEDTSFNSSYSSHLCDISLDTSVTISSDTSKDKESSLENVRGRPHSLGSSLDCEKKHRQRSMEEGPYIPIFSTPSRLDSSILNRAGQNLPDHLPKYLEDGFIDTHCHLDMLYSKMAFRGTFSKFRMAYETTFPEEFEGCIADFCDPRTLNNSLWEDLLKEDMVWGAFGCHPHFARYYSDLRERNLLQAMRHPKAIAFGEIGLDYSYKCSTEVPTQHKVFERQLNLAVSLRKPLVIHCRDADDDLLKIMKKCVPKDYKIHRHCFTGRYNVIEPLLDYFPNMTVGFTALLTYPSANEAREAVTKIPISRIVVETDAPYFLPRQVPKSVCQYSHPGVALHTVRELARLKEVPLSIMMAALRRNTQKIYDL